MEDIINRFLWCSIDEYIFSQKDLDILLLYFNQNNIPFKVKENKMYTTFINKDLVVELISAYEEKKLDLGNLEESFSMRMKYKKNSNISHKKFNKTFKKIGGYKFFLVIAATALVLIILGYVFK